MNGEWTRVGSNPPIQPQQKKNKREGSGSKKVAALLQFFYPFGSSRRNSILTVQPGTDGMIQKDKEWSKYF